MSQYRDSLPDDETRARYDAACAAAGRVLAAGCRDRDRLYLEQGALAVGRAAFYPGHRLGSPEAIAEAYEARRARVLAA